jgi:hypothetical protein
MTQRLPAAILTVFVLVGTVPARAQDTISGSIVGTVRDSSGGALPGVTVEASSPALIERTRTVVTDSQGRYRIIDLRPGTYAVTFSLPAFVTLRREGIELTTGFAATVNAELAIGAVSETITVSGAAPTVDVSNTAQQLVLSREIIQALPVGKNSAAFVSVIPGATQAAANIDVGGTKNEQAQNFTVHGGGTLVQLRDGLFLGLPIGGQNHSMSSPPPSATQETSIQVNGGLGAEAIGAGVQINYVPRDGGNTFNGSFAADFGADALQSSNLDDELRSRGLTATTRIKTLYDVNGGFGGPLLRDRVWFFSSARKLENSSYVAGNYYNRRDLTGSLFYVADLDNPAYFQTYSRDVTTRLSVRASDNDRLSATYRLEKGCNCFDQVGAGARAPDGTGLRESWPIHMLQLGWTRTISNRLLVEGRYGFLDGKVTNTDTNLVPGAISVTDQSRGYTYSAPPPALTNGIQDWVSSQGYASASYVTGSHNLKFGVQLRAQAVEQILDETRGTGISYVFTGSAPGTATPVSVNYFIVPYADKSQNQQHALYVQDQWAISRFTLNLGLRFEYFKAYFPEQNQPAGPFVPARSFPAVDDAARLTDLNPRLGVAWDLFGTGRTAIKVATGRFQLVQAVSGFTTTLNPLQRLSTTNTRSWTDLNRDYIPQESELGPFSNANFGNLGAVTQTFDDELTHGFGTLPYSWQSSVTLSHELRPGLAVNVGYFRTTNGNQTVTDNLLRSPSDYDSFCLNAPIHPDLPGGGGYQICGINDVKPEKVSAVQNQVRRASNYGGQSNIYNGVDLTASYRFGNGGFLTGGTSISKTVTDNCDVVARLPETLISAPFGGGAAPGQNCRTEPPLKAGTDFKVSFTHELPWNFRGSVNYQNVPSIATTAAWVVPNSVIAPVLGRNLAACRAGVACTATLTVPLVANNSLYLEDRTQLLNFAVSRDFTLRGITVRPRFQLDNALNANPVNTVNNTFGANWRRVQGVLTPRTAKIAFQMEF